MKLRNINKIIYRSLAITLIVFLFSTFLISGLLARFITNDNNLTDARVSYWKINAIDKDGTKSTLNKAITHLESEDTGNWFFQVENQSEVNAVINNLSNIMIKIESYTFKDSTVLSDWDFLTDEGNPINNPITFNVYLYNCACDDLDQYIVYTKGTSKLSKNDYDLLSDAEKVGYVEDVDLTGISTITETLVLSTDSDDLIVNKKTELSETYLSINKSLGNDYKLKNNTGIYTFRLEWDVELIDDEGVGSTDTFNAFYIIEQSEYNTTDYTGLITYNSGNKKISYKEGASATTSGNYYELLVDVDGVNTYKNFVLAYKECDYFEYLIYTSSLGGEPFFTELTFNFNKLETKSSGFYKKAYKKLTTEEINIISTRTIVDVNTKDINNTTTISYNTLKKYHESLELNQYLDFLTSQEEFENSVGYLGIGLICTITFNIIIEQED